MQDRIGTINAVRASSTREGRIFRVLSPSEKRSRTPVRPFMNEIFSSLDLDANVERSKKLSVEIDRDEKKGWADMVDGVGRLSGCLVIKDASKPTAIVVNLRP